MKIPYSIKNFEHVFTVRGIKIIVSLKSSQLLFVQCNW